jgi:phosphatidylinositol alpha 1,6-mannosyltransferase
MASGLPVIAVDRLGPKEIVTAGETGWLVPPDDAEALAAALAEAIGDADERHRRGAAARVDALERFSWPAIADRVDGVLREAGGLATGRRAAI